MKCTEYMRASANLCFGRELLINEIKMKCFEKGSVLLFGGRQAGKTTILLKLEKDMGQQRADVKILSDLDLAVYIDLTSLPAEATPADFFSLLCKKAYRACKQNVNGFRGEPIHPSIWSQTKDCLGEFIKVIASFIKNVGETDLRFIFLLDEAKRILSRRFPRGFQDNLFSLLYGSHNIISGRVGIVFSGAQDLLDFCEDETSPIGSRAGQCFVSCLDFKAVSDIVESTSNNRFSKIPAEEIAKCIFNETGGHAGLTARLAQKYFSHKAYAIPELADRIADEDSMLFRIWTESLSKEARAIHPSLYSSGQLARSEIANALRDCGMDPFRSASVVKEFVFTGIAMEDGDILRLVNNIYWKFVGSIGCFPATILTVKMPPSQEEPLQRRCWAHIEELEVKLREYIVSTYKEKWGDAAISMMKSALGNSSWETIETNLRKAMNQYPLCREKRYLREVDGMYTGQLVQLILWKKAWPLFQPYLPNKNEIERWLKEVNPVRNDQAHFRQVPKKELNRCFLACDDFMVSIDRAVEKMQFKDCD
jgi:hypothetical protein